MPLGRDADESAPSTRFLVAAVMLGAVIVGGSLVLGRRWGIGEIGAEDRPSPRREPAQLSLVAGSPEKPTPAPAPTPKKDFLPVYGMDSAVNQMEVNFHVAVPRYASREDKLKKLAERVSRFRFDNHPVEVKDVVSQDGRRVAIIDLREPNWDGYGWRTGYFQGSAGARATRTTLTRTFAQPNYSGNWVDGVKFLYEGEPIREGDWSHLNLSGTFWRSEMPTELP